LKAKKFTDRRAGNKFSRIVKVAKPNDNGKIKVTRIRCFKIQLWLFLKLKTGNLIEMTDNRWQLGCERKVRAPQGRMLDNVQSARAEG